MNQNLAISHFSTHSFDFFFFFVVCSSSERPLVKFPFVYKEEIIMSASLGQLPLTHIQSIPQNCIPKLPSFPHQPWGPTAIIISLPVYANLLIHLLSSTFRPQFILHFNWITSPTPLLKTFCWVPTTLRIKSNSVTWPARLYLIWPLQPPLLPSFCYSLHSSHTGLYSTLQANQALFCLKAFAHAVLYISNAYPPPSSSDIYSSFGAPFNVYSMFLRQTSLSWPFASN